ncbi:N-6 DNA methylase [Roseiterribacter gracilis]|uniref:site-specific DNA-methyltransferase (adenine-specific) n=1 Tax=Roseiterribacter gracilis TaxID=2812848 RepID=A0A8S8XHQ9_9PROT|nr:restriction endonuclease [Rhodospirillales bacterium TMPK1]
MNFKALESAQKLRGGYYTPPPIAEFLGAWALEKNPSTVLEPGCGDGSFLRALGTVAKKKLRVLGIERDKNEARKAQAVVTFGNFDATSQVRTADFFDWVLQNKATFDSIVGNPPFIRYQYLEPDQQSAAEKLFASHGLPFTKHTNAWVTFVLASMAALNPGGRLAMVVPSELLHVLHASGLRQYLLQHCATIQIVDIQEIVFGDTLQGTVLLLAEKRERGDTSPARLAIKRIANAEAIWKRSSKLFTDVDWVIGADLTYKWMAAYLSKDERLLLADLTQRGAAVAFNDVAKVDVGMVTGANKFFLVTDETVREHKLEAYAVPMFGRSDHVSGVIYGARDHADNAKRGQPTNFLDFSSVGARMPANVKRYLALGEEEGIHRRFKCRVRKPWYVVPSIYATPVGMLKRCHHFPRLVRNKLGAYTTDTAYRIDAISKIYPPDTLVASFVNSLTALSAELVGRHYGGGVLELVPSEIERLALPSLPAKFPAQLVELDKAVRASTPAVELLEQRDEIVLRGAGLTPDECALLRGGWQKLSARRQRSSTTPDGANPEDGWESLAAE